MDSLAHLIECVRIGAFPRERDLLPDYLAELASRAYSVDPNLPAPLRAGCDAEIDLIESDAEESEISQLDFEDDAEGRFDAGLLLLPDPAGGEGDTG